MTAEGCRNGLNFNLVLSILAEESILGQKLIGSFYFVAIFRRHWSLRYLGSLPLHNTRKFYWLEDDVLGLN